MSDTRPTTKPSSPAPRPKPAPHLPHFANLMAANLGMVADTCTDPQTHALAQARCEAWAAEDLARQAEQQQALATERGDHDTAAQWAERAQQAWAKCDDAETRAEVPA